MFTAIKTFLFGTNENNGDTTMKAFITPTTNGRFALESGGQVLGTYARRRDAIRGAARRELHVITN